MFEDNRYVVINFLYVSVSKYPLLIRTPGILDSTSLKTLFPNGSHSKVLEVRTSTYKYGEGVHFNSEQLLYFRTVLDLHKNYDDNIESSYIPYPVHPLVLSYINIVYLL